jgi:hypothetical protein
MSSLFSTHTMAFLFSELVARRRPSSPERRRAAMHAALGAYAGRLRRQYGAPTPQPRRPTARQSVRPLLPSALTSLTHSTAR